MNSALAVFLLKFLGPIVGGCVAMVSDIRERRIPNWLSVTLLVTGLLFQVIFYQLTGLVNGLGGAALGFSVLFALFAVGGGGAGDVKFMTGVGAWIGPYHTLMVFVLSALVLGVFVLCWAVLRTFKTTKPTDNSLNQSKSSAPVSVFRTRIPYAVPLTAALVLRLIWMLFIGRTS